MGTFISDYVQFCTKKYPSIASVENLAQKIEFTISNEIVNLPLSLFERVDSAIKKIYEFGHSADFIAELRKKNAPEMASILDFETSPSSVLMAYDFHYIPDTQRLALIEVNTNASMYLPCAALYEFKNMQFGRSTSDPIALLKSSFFAEAERALKNKKSLSVDIIDENVTQQRMYFEFLMYRDLINSFGWQAKIKEANGYAPTEVDLVYNRNTDFYLTTPGSAALLSAWLKHQVLVTPHSREYLLLADKERLIDFYRHKINDSLLATESIAERLKGQSEEAKNKIIEELWARRKQLFFKPKNSFGGKAAFRGNSISRKVFADLVAKDFIAQEYLPAPELNGKKFDLRFYVYRNEIHLACARIYSGQTTNFNSSGGGIAAIKFTTN